MPLDAHTAPLLVNDVRQDARVPSICEHRSGPARQRQLLVHFPQQEQTVIATRLGEISGAAAIAVLTRSIIWSVH